MLYQTAVGCGCGRCKLFLIDVRLKLKIRVFSFPSIPGIERILFVTSIKVYIVIHKAVLHSILKYLLLLKLPVF
ncbi:hypothetical protein FKM82_025566 [Ascaphus truei]